MLRISHLSKTYPNGVQALKDISLSIGNGIFGLLGPNGSGKSTLMRTIATLQDPDSGSIYFNEIPVLEKKEELRTILGYLPQEFGVYPTCSAEEMLNHLAILKGMADSKKRKETVHYLLEVTNLFEHRKKKLGGFSGGMKQRFGIAQALLGNPRLIIVDEPTAGLDPLERDRFHSLLSYIGEETTVILSTHIISDVKELCNDMAILYEGNILMQRPPLEALEELQGKVWKILLPKSIEENSEWQILSSRLLHGKKMIKVFSEKAPSSAFTVAEPDLEDLYFSFIKGYTGNVPTSAL